MPIIKDHRRPVRKTETHIDPPQVLGVLRYQRSAMLQRMKQLLVYVFDGEYSVTLTMPLSYIRTNYTYPTTA